MFGSSQEYFHPQVVGKMSFAVNRLEYIDPDNLYKNIRDDYQEEIHWINEVKYFHTILEASKSGKCPDFDILQKKAFLLQELARLITLIKPFSMKKELVESMYEQMKKQNKLDGSFYHLRLNDLEWLTQSVENMPLPARSFLHAVVGKLQLHIAETGLVQDDTEANKLFQLSVTMKKLGYQNFDLQFASFKAFMDAQTDAQPFNGVLSEVEQSQTVKIIIDHLTPKLTSDTLRGSLQELTLTGELDKKTFNTINAIFKQDGELKALNTTYIKHMLDKDRINSIFVMAYNRSPKDAIQRTALLCDLALLGKAYPAVQDIIDSVSQLSNKEISALQNSPDFLHKIISSIVNSRVKPQSMLETNSLDQLLIKLKEQLTESGVINSAMNLNQMYKFINKQVQTVIDEIPHRKEQLESLGFGIPTFKNIEAVINSLDDSHDPKINAIIKEFYTAIQNAKKTHFDKMDIKLIEHITAKDFNDFFKDCCEAGKIAAQKLDDNRSGVTIVVDILKAIANWGIYILSGGSTPQFFKKPKTAVDDITQAVGDLKITLAHTLNHLNLNEFDDATEVVVPQGI